MQEIKRHDYSKFAHGIFEVYSVIKTARKFTNYNNQSYFNQFLVRALSFRHGCKPISVSLFMNIQQDIVQYFTDDGTDEDIKNIQESLLIISEHFYSERIAVNTYEISESFEMLVYELIFKSFVSAHSIEFSNECINQSYDMAIFAKREDLAKAIDEMYRGL